MEYISNDFLEIEKVKILIEKEFIFKDDNNNTFLHKIFENENIDLKILKFLINFLLEKKFNLNLKNKNGETPLFILCLNYKNFNIFKYFVNILIKNKYDLNIKNKESITPFFLLSENFNINYKLFNFIINLNIYNFNEKNKLNYSFLHNLCENKQINKKIIKIVIEKIDSINQKNIYGETAFHLLCKNEGIKMSLIKYFLDFLIENNHNFNLFDKNKYTPFNNLCCNFSINYEILKYFTNILIKNFEIKEDNSLILLCKNEEITFKMLVFLLNKFIENGYYINYTDKFGKTALYYLCENNKIFNLNLILKFLKYYIKEDLINDLEEKYYEYKKEINYFFNYLYYLK